MKSNTDLNIKIQNNIRDLAKIIHDISIKLPNEPLTKALQNKFLSLSVNVGDALDIPMQ